MTTTLRAATYLVSTALLLTSGFAFANTSCPDSTKGKPIQMLGQHRVLCQPIGGGNQCPEGYLMHFLQDSARNRITRAQVGPGRLVVPESGTFLTFIKENIGGEMVEGIGYCAPRGFKRPSATSGGWHTGAMTPSHGPMPTPSAGPLVRYVPKNADECRGGNWVSDSFNNPLSGSRGQLSYCQPINRTCGRMLGYPLTPELVSYGNGAIRRMTCVMYLPADHQLLRSHQPSRPMSSSFPR